MSSFLGVAYGAMEGISEEYHSASRQTPSPSHRQIIYHVLHVGGTSRFSVSNESHILGLSFASAWKLLSTILLRFAVAMHCYSITPAETSLATSSGHNRQISACITQYNSLIASTSSQSIQSDSENREKDRLFRQGWI